jgi:acetoin utilization deacetylase AcuC-like enzyme
MGFCLFNNVAVGALHAREAHGLHRIAVVDFDVHHGNGTQAAFWDDPDLFYASTHQMPALSRDRLGTRARRQRQHRERTAAAGGRLPGVPRGDAPQRRARADRTSSRNFS